MMERPLLDTVLIATFVLFFLFEAVALRRDGKLGWAMLGKCLTVAALFFYGLIRPAYPQLDQPFFIADTALGHVVLTVGTVLRLLTFAAMAVAVPLIAWERWGPPPLPRWRSRIPR